jgi:hypothetical protein
MAKLTEDQVMTEMQPELGTLAPVVAGPVAALTIPPGMASALPAAVRAELARLPVAKQDEFALAYRTRSRSLLLAYLSSLVYCHYLLLGRWAMSGMMFLSLFIAAALGWIWWLIDLVRMPEMVREHNHRVAVEILQTLTAPTDPTPLAGT